MRFFYSMRGVVHVTMFAGVLAARAFYHYVAHFSIQSMNIGKNSIAVAMYHNTYRITYCRMVLSYKGNPDEEGCYT